MKKLSLLAASVAVALTGCGGGDGSGSSSDNSSGNSGVTITGFDGYFENAVVFIDKNNDGKWDVSDKVLGLTDKNGQLNVGETKPQGTLALQILNGDNSDFTSQLIANELNLNLFTVDSDFPGQPVEKPLVFRAPNSSDVISPITDLVAIEMAANSSLTEAEAILEVSKAFNDGVEEQSFDPYTDFVSGNQADPLLHKTAQVLTASKGEDPTAYQTKAKEIAKEAKLLVDTLTEEQQKDPTYVTSVDGDPQTNSTLSFKTTVSAEVQQRIQDELDELDLEIGTPGARDYFIRLDLTELFVDKDAVITSELIKIDAASLSGSNIEAVYASSTDFQLNIGVSDTKVIAKAGEFRIVVHVGNSNDTNATSAIFTLDVDKGDASAPEVTDHYDVIEQQIENWSLTEGEEVPSQAQYVISYAGLFNHDNFAITLDSSLESNGLSFTKDENAKTFTLTGTPTKASEDYDVDFKVWITATDTQTGLSEKVTFDVPEIAAESLHPLEAKDLFFIETPEWGSAVNLSHCVSFRLEDGQFFLGDTGHSESLTVSCAPVSSTASGSYTIDGDIITIAENGEDPMTLEIKHTSEQGDATRFMVRSVEQNADQSTHVAMFEAIDDKEEAESRINQRSTLNWDDLSQITTLKINGQYVELHITAQMRNQSDNGNGVADADLWVENMAGSITCNDMQASFDGISFGDLGSNQGCRDEEETRDGVTYEYVSYDFDSAAEFVDQSTHRIFLFGLTDEEPSFNMNMTFDGNSSYD
ncbi:hypothetical protein BIY21_05850 [Vibrio ponticus]|uniref:Acid phosphatase n=1 Tax=Vibrio ponticus TaxID=265668 RepID=A0ABX3FPB4_9VIBR|nr:hypothetical protein [Vibrio ponticus]OLQ95772.1 hypothetical protein BIY21_05850 [Vibrio ponticus]